MQMKVDKYQIYSKKFASHETTNSHFILP